MAGRALNKILVLSLLIGMALIHPDKGFSDDLIRTAVSGPEISPFCLILRAAQDPKFSSKYKLTFEDIALATAQFPVVVADGDVNIAQCSGTSNIFNAWQKGARNLFVYAFGSQAPVFQMIAQPNIEKLADLKGKLIGIQGVQSAVAEAAEMMLKRGANLLPGRDYDFVQRGVNSASVAAMVAKRVDAVPFYPPFSYTLEKQGFKIIADESTYVPRYVTGLSIANRTWVEKNHDLFVRFLEALVEAGAWFKDPVNESDVETWFTQHLSAGGPERLDMATAKRMYEFYIKDNRLALDSYVPESTVRANLDILKERGYIKDEDIPPLGQVIDMSYLNEARHALGMPPVQDYAK